MGPMSTAKDRRPKGRTAHQRHANCRQGKNCKGPGCVVSSGKTESKNR